MTEKDLYILSSRSEEELRNDENNNGKLDADERQEGELSAEVIVLASILHVDAKSLANLSSYEIQKIIYEHKVADYTITPDTSYTPEVIFSHPAATTLLNSCAIISKPPTYPHSNIAENSKVLDVEKTKEQQLLQDLEWGNIKLKDGPKTPVNPDAIVLMEYDVRQTGFSDDNDKIKIVPIDRHGNPIKDSMVASNVKDDKSLNGEKTPENTDEKAQAKLQKPQASSSQDNTDPVSASPPKITLHLTPSDKETLKLQWGTADPQVTANDPKAPLDPNAIAETLIKHEVVTDSPENNNANLHLATGQANTLEMNTSGEAPVKSPVKTF